MEIRFLSSKDSLPDISNIYESSWKYTYKDIIPQHFLESIPKGKWAGSITKEGMHSLVMTEQGRIIGTATFCQSRWAQYPDYGEIVSIYFLPDCIGKGYGRHLLNRCTEELNRIGFQKILLWVLEDNQRARRFYEKNGFRCTGEYRNDVIGGKPLREVLYLQSNPDT